MFINTSIDLIRKNKAGHVFDTYRWDTWVSMATNLIGKIEWWNILPWPRKDLSTWFLLEGIQVSLQKDTMLTVLEWKCVLKVYTVWLA